jgi:hypothetical protein
MSLHTSTAPLVLTQPPKAAWINQTTHIQAAMRRNVGGNGVPSHPRTGSDNMRTCAASKLTPTKPPNKCMVTTKGYNLSVTVKAPKAP